jgi:transcriptional regulator with XRE-family HTH domain
MPPWPRLVPASPQPDAAERCLHVHGIEEMPAGYDAEVAELFRDLRAASALSEADLAARLGTRPDVVQALEQGALYALPPWAETCRVVNAYGALLNLDVRPLLRRIYAQLEAGIVELRPKAMPDVPVMMPRDNSDFAFRPDSGSRPDRQAAPSGKSPLDIDWTPEPVPTRPQTPPPPQPAQKPQAPQAPWQNASPAPQSRPRGPLAPPPQVPWTGGAPQRPAGPPQQAERRPEQRPPQAPQGQHPQGRPLQGQAPQGQVPRGQAPQRPPQPQPPQARQPAPPQTPKPRAEFTPPPPPLPSAAPRAIPDAAMEEPPAVEEKPKRKSALLKWGVIALLIAIMAFGAWLVLHSMTGPSVVKSPTTGSQPLDPDDPRSRKADKLQGPS